MRIFISHSSKNTDKARALKKWLIDTEESLEGEIFLDAADLLPGSEWKPALQAANRQCEAVICLLSTAWEQSSECQLEFRYAETLNKDILCARLEAIASDKTRAWQHCDLFADPPEAEVITIPLDDGTSVSLAAEGLEKMHRGLIELGTVRDYFRWPPQSDPGRSPYRGWADLDIDDAAVFFGRDAEIVSALDTLKGMHKTGVASMLVIQGSSGAGKSAFLRAGLLPRIHKDSRFLPMDVVRPEHDVLAGPNGLARSIHQLRTGLGLNEPELLVIEQGCQTADINQVTEWINEARLAAAPPQDPGAKSPGAPTIVIALDQAEELFATSHQEPATGDDAERFLQIIAELLQQHDGTAPAVVMLATVRSDSYELLQNSPALAGVGSVSFNELTPMHPSLFGQVIEGPAARQTKDVEPLNLHPTLVKRLIADCPDADALPLLALTLEQLIFRYGTTGTRTLAEYQQLGGVESIVDTVVDRAVGAPGDAERDNNLAILRRAFIPAMATINVYDQPQRRLADWKSLPPDSYALLDKLADNHVLTKTERPGGTVIEVAIEILLRRWGALSRWLTDESRYLKIAERVELSALEWEQHQRAADQLEHRGDRLRDAENLADQGRYFIDRDVPTTEYLQACRRAERRRLVRARIVQATITAAIVVVIVTLVMTALAYRQSHKNFREATAEQLTSGGQAMLAGARPDGDYRAIQQLITAPLVTSASKLNFIDRWTTAPMSASPSIDGALLDAVNGRRNLHKIVQTNSPITSVAFNHDRTVMATGDIDGTVSFWDPATLARRSGPWKTTHGYVWSVAFAGDTLVTGANDGTVETWDSAGNHSPLSGSKVGNPTRSIATTANSTVVAAGNIDGNVRIWDISHPQEMREIGVPGGPVESVALHDNLLATGSQDGTIQLWSLAGSKPSAYGDPISDGSSRQPVWCVAFSSDGRRLAAAGQSPDVWVYDIDTRRRVALPHRGGVWAVTFSPTDRYIATGGIDDAVKVWDARSNAKVGDLVTGDGGDVKALAFVGDGLVSVGDDKTLRLWSIPTPPPAVPAPQTDKDRVIGLIVKPNRIVSTTASGVMQQWNAQGIPGASTPAPIDTNTAPAVDPAAASAAMILPGHTVEFWTADRHATGVQILLPADVTDAAITVGGDRLAAISRKPDIVRFWDVHSGRQVGSPVDVGDREIRSMRLSSDGRLLATSDSTGRIDVWDTDTAHLVSQRPMTGDADSDVRARRVSLAFSDDNRLLVSGAAGDDQLREWEFAAGTQIGSSMAGHQRDVTAVAFGHDNRYIISGGKDGTVRLWDAVHQRPAGQALAITQPPGDAPQPDHMPLYPTAVAISADGKLIVAGLNDGTVQTWPGPTNWAAVLCDKVTEELTTEQWHDWVGPKIDQFDTCP